MVFFSILTWRGAPALYICRTHVGVEVADVALVDEAAVHVVLAGQRVEQKPSRGSQEADGEVEPGLLHQDVEAAVPGLRLAESQVHDGRRGHGDGAPARVSLGLTRVRVEDPADINSISFSRKFSRFYITPIPFRSNIHLSVGRGLDQGGNSPAFRDDRLDILEFQTMTSSCFWTDIQVKSKWIPCYSYSLKIISQCD